MIDLLNGSGQGKITMDELLIIANWLVPLIYLAMVIDYGATFLLRLRTHVRNRWILIPILFHVAFLVLRGIQLGSLPIGRTEEILSLIALSSTIVYWMMEFVSRDRRAGFFVFLLIFLFQYASSAFVAGSTIFPPSESAIQHGWGRAHVIPATFSYTALAFAAIYGLLHLMGRRDLKRHRFGLLFDRLPPLDLLGRLSWYSLLGGFIFLTISIVTGIVVFGQAGDVAQPEILGHKVALKIITGSLAWLICGVTILGKCFAKWSASKVSLVAVSGFLVILILLVASIFLS